MPAIVPLVELPAVPGVLVPLGDVPEVEPVVDPLELLPYGSGELLLEVPLELPIVTFVRMNCALEDELRSDVLPVVEPAGLPDVPVVPIDPASAAGVTQPVRVIVRESRFDSWCCPIWLDELGFV